MTPLGIGSAEKSKKIDEEEIKRDFVELRRRAEKMVTWKNFTVSVNCHDHKRM